MFVRREGWLPLEDSLESIEESANTVLNARHGDPSLRLYLQHHNTRLGFDLDYTNEFAGSGARILEIGGWPYFLTLSLSRNGFDVETVDKNTQNVADLINGFSLKVHCADIEKGPLPLKDESYDYIIINEVFEHLRIDLIYTFKELMRVLKKNGRITLSTPNLRSMAGLYNLLFKGEAYSCEGGGIFKNYETLHSDILGSMGHVREYTPKEVIDFLGKMGFEVEGIVYRACYERPRWWHYATLLRPELKPFFSIFARKV